MRILIIDDDAIVGALLGEMLDLMGHDVCSIETSEPAGILAAARLRPDLLIVDVRLGRGSGISVVRQVMIDTPTPHLFVSGDLASVRIEMPLSAMLLKPYSEAQLASGIQRAIGATSH